MDLDKILWYVNRLRSMQRKEVLHRVSEAWEVRRPQKSLAGRSIPSFNQSESPHCRLLDLRHVLLMGGSSSYCRSLAVNVMQGSISVFGHPWSTAAKQWNVDPVSGYEWPELPAHKIDYRHSSLADPKWTWEINRLLFLLPVAFAVDAGEIERTAGENMIAETLSDWIARNRPGYGPQWAASIEVAIRAIVMTACLQVFGKVASDLHNDVAQSISEHARWIKRFPSLYSSANNHRVAEIAALLILSSSWTELLSRKELVALEEELVDVSQLLFASDGIGLEQSPTYAGFSLEFLAMVLHCYRWDSQRLREELEHTVHSAAYALAQFTNEDGSLIRYGDDDEGKVLSVAVTENEYSAALVRLASEDPQPRRHGVLTFEKGGITLTRHMDSSHETTWVFDHGPLGFGDIAAHGHADVLAVSMRAAGVNWIVDAGTYKYHGNKKWRTYFRSSAAHNAPQLDKQDSSVMTGDFNWDPKKRALGDLVFSFVDDVTYCLQASHDGYARQGLGTVRRTLERCAEGEYRITDTAESRAEMMTGFLLNPDCRVAAIDDGWEISHPASVLKLSVRVSGHSVLCQEAPEDERAWFSPAFGKKLPTWRLIAEAADSDHGRQLVFDFVFLNPSEQEA